jgi:hypothetical protein
MGLDHQETYTFFDVVYTTEGSEVNFKVIIKEKVSQKN